ncbi:cystatin-like isoform X2 [Hoplias malabaricus]
MFVKLVAVVLVLAPCLAMEGSGMIGGLTDADMDDTKVQKALQFAIDEHKKASNDMWISHVTRVISAKEQVVGGMKYIFTVEMVRTSCRKGEREGTCHICWNPNIAQLRVCTLTVWTRSWLGKMEVMEDTCL